MIDWDLAVRTAGLLVPPGPNVTPAEARAVADELRALVPRAERVVSDLTGLPVPPADVPVAVVDRIGWVRANVAGFEVALEPLVEKLAARREAPGAVKAVTGKVAGVQVGTLLAYLASRVLGQFELFLPPGEAAGRLTLVAPNILETERRLGVVPADFRYWVTIHEVTHRTQFTAVPWLRDHFTGLVREFVERTELDPAQVAERLRAIAAAARDAVAGRPVPSLIEVVQTPAQREVLDRAQALMSLLEGHGDYVMDAVGADVVPTGAEIRRRFDARRRGGSPVDRLVRRLLGLDLKLRQYERGARFVRAVVESEGMDRFNAVWSSPEALPTLAEIERPEDWVARVLPVRAVEGA